ncbi:hypothetical protein M0802_005488 [Mischocyttarus mexicanus]|nr:hypothetical protein M0802_005488 [Mischocyttarus mexicanus]
MKTMMVLVLVLVLLMLEDEKWTSSEKETRSQPSVKKDGKRERFEWKGFRSKLSTKSRGETNIMEIVDNTLKFC